MIIAVYTSKGKGISYSVTEENGDFVIEAEVLGTYNREKTFLGCCGEKKAIKTAKLLAKKAVRPVHIEDIISDMHF